MPKALRPMKSDGNPPLPIVGDGAKYLCLRTKDLPPDTDGNAVPDQGGLSVVSSMQGLRIRMQRGKFPPTMVPRRLADQGILPGAIGKNDIVVFALGNGAFEEGVIAENLKLVPDVDHHGTIQPDRVMPYEQYRTAIHETKNLWRDGEKDE